HSVPHITLSCHSERTEEPAFSLPDPRLPIPDPVIFPSSSTQLSAPSRHPTTSCAAPARSLFSGVRSHMATAVANEREHITALSQLTLNPSASAEAVRHIAALNTAQRDELVSLADSNHVIIRGLQPVVNGALSLNLPEVAQWAQAVIDKERARIMNALSRLEVICNELEAAGAQTTVMKSLDHWPDLGNDLDLYSTADEKLVCRVMTDKFKAHIEPRSWGDRLANKWNFQVPELPEAVEVHVQRLGQTGEHTALARRFVTRRVQKTVE